ncbi:MAG: PEP-CTERM sorting domain-containing protein [Gammaproteobacteria bacterium]|nr:PEP-CTERM sorting domain-containing protein [Gammaproteobacteria bacterium]
MSQELAAHRWQARSLAARLSCLFSRGKFLIYTPSVPAPMLDNFLESIAMKTRKSLLALRQRNRILAPSALLLAVSALPVQAIPVAPQVTVTADNDVYNVPLQEVSKGTNGEVTYEINSYEFEVAGEYAFTINRARLDPDPSITYGITVVDFGAPTTFLFSFTTPIAPTGSPNLVGASLIGTLTDGGNDGVTITSTGAKIQSSEVGTPFTTMGVDVNIGESAGPLVGPIGSWNLLSANVGFMLSGGGDSASLSGTASINEGQLPDDTVPEPTTLVLMGLGLAGIGYQRRRSKKAA